MKPTAVASYTKHMYYVLEFNKYHAVNSSHCSSLSQDGATPLIVASGRGHSDVVNILLRGGAGVNLAMNVSNDKLSLTIHIVIENMLVKVKEYGQDLVCMTVTMKALKCKTFSASPIADEVELSMILSYTDSAALTF